MRVVNLRCAWRSFGYIIGFCIGTYVTGLIAEKMKEKTIRGYMTANFTGLLIVYALSLRTRDWGQSTVLC